MRLFPDTASQWAEKVDLLNAYLFAWILFFTGLIFLGVVLFAIVYRRRSSLDRPKPILGSTALELTWSVIPFMIALTMFGWAASLYFEYASPPSGAMEVYVTGKQWMFHTQHANGNREINELHVPSGRAVRLVMSSEDVIHSFFIPAFRVKHDLIPGRFTSIWFTATKPGKYNLFCAEYCGTKHSMMGGWVYVMEPADFERWANGGGSESMAFQGEKLFSRLGCASCHRSDAPGRCPMLKGVFGSQILLQSGPAVLADEGYLRESILNPEAKIVQGYQNIMPSYQGQINEQSLLQLISYIRSLGSPAGAQKVEVKP